MNHQDKIAIIGLGYVGLPLAISFGRIFETIGFDIDKSRIEELDQKKDRTNEIKPEDFSKASNLTFSSNPKHIKDANIYIIGVPTPIDIHKQPDLTYLKSACELVGPNLLDEDIVVFESTVYPGATEDFCVPILERLSKLKYINEENKSETIEGFYCGYSPERINPGDKINTLTKIKKVVSGSTKEILEKIDQLYSSIIEAGIIRASSIKVAESAKAIENTQRDLNIALVNEFAIIFNQLNIDTEEVLNIASTKWNFTHYKPGLVGGHCIGVDPYYLAFKAIEVDYYPEIILAGRKLNDGMGFYIAQRVIKLMTRKDIPIHHSNILIMGFSFKENCPDIRNTRVIDIIDEFKKYACNIDVYDPWVNPVEANSEYSIDLIKEPKNDYYDAVVIAVAHEDFINIGLDEIKNYTRNNHIIFDAKYLFGRDVVDGRL